MCQQNYGKSVAAIGGSTKASSSSPRCYHMAFEKISGKLCFAIGGSTGTTSSVTHCCHVVLKKRKAERYTLSRLEVTAQEQQLLPRCTRLPHGLTEKKWRQIFYFFFGHQHNKVSARGKTLQNTALALRKIPFFPGFLIFSEGNKQFF
jgi:hypothetical protein